jgi:hypothetical protein
MALKGGLRVMDLETCFSATEQFVRMLSALTFLILSQRVLAPLNHLLRNLLP